MLKFSKYISIFIFLFSLTILAQKKNLTFEQAYLGASPRLTKALPIIEISGEKDSYLVKGKNEIEIVNLTSNEKKVLINYNELNKNLPDGFDLTRASTHTKDYSKFILSKNANLYLYDKMKNKFSQLTTDNNVEKNPTFSPNENLIAYTKNNNLYIFNIEEKRETQLTADGSDIVYNGYASWVYYEEILGRASHYRAFYWSPDSKQISFMRFDDSKVPTFTLFNADGVHGELEVRHYPKPGDANPDVKLGVINVGNKKTTWIDSTINKGNYIAWPKFTNDNKRIIYQRMNRGQDTLEIMLTNTNKLSPKSIYMETQKTWVEFFEDIYLLQNKDEFIIRSEVNGWHHLYHYNFDGKLLKQITDGNWEVTNIALVDEVNNKIYFHANKGETTEKHLYQILIDGSELKQLTTESGTHSCTIIPNGNYFLDRFSSINNPTQLVLHNLLKNEKSIISNSKLPEMDNYNLGKVELFTIPTEDGYNLPAKWFLPPNFDVTKKYPIIFSIYGGPGIATVRNSFPRRGLGNYYLAQNGIIVIAVDNRGSGHFGKRGKDELYRNLGTWEIDDLITAVKWLRKKSFIDSSKIAITGGSYGGYTTSMALARAGNYFKYGIAKYAVTDWRLYDNIYTERYMDTPKENPEGYEYGSVMTHASDYTGGMLITHGSLDDNVHMQNTIQLIDKLQNLNKEFELMIYPNQRHGIRYPKYPHSMKLDVNFWFKNLLGK